MGPAVERVARQFNECERHLNLETPASGFMKDFPTLRITVLIVPMGCSY